MQPLTRSRGSSSHQGTAVRTFARSITPYPASQALKDARTQKQHPLVHRPLFPSEQDPAQAMPGQGRAAGTSPAWRELLTSDHQYHRGPWAVGRKTGQRTGQHGWDRRGPHPGLSRAPSITDRIGTHQGDGWGGEAGGCSAHPGVAPGHRPQQPWGTESQPRGDAAPAALTCRAARTATGPGPVPVPEGPRSSPAALLAPLPPLL